MVKTGVLLVNTGTPDSKNPLDVRRYLNEFLTDPRILDIPWLQRQILARWIIVPKRYRESAHNYARIWTDKGSPLKTNTETLVQLLAESLGLSFQVEYAMRYGSPTIASALERLKNCPKWVILPLFPQYASATTGSVHQKVMEIVLRWNTIPNLHFISSYPTQPSMIQAFAARGREFKLTYYDQILFSFHGLPERQLRKADCNRHCLQSSECCHRFSEKNRMCYAAQCYATARAISNRLEIPASKISVSFQSRLGKEPWLQPYTSEALDDFIRKGSKRVLVFSPSFVADCLETLDEIGNEYRSHFLENGGEALDLVPSLNDHPLWIQALKELVLHPDHTLGI